MNRMTTQRVELFVRIATTNEQRSVPGLTLVSASYLETTKGILFEFVNAQLKDRWFFVKVDSPGSNTTTSSTSSNTACRFDVAHVGSCPAPSGLARMNNIHWKIRCSVLLLYLFR